MLRPILRPVTRAVTRALFGGAGSPMLNWMYSLDGVNDYGVFASRILTVSADLDISWTHKNYVPGAAQTIVSQSTSATATARGFVITVTGASLAVNLGGATTTFSSVYSDGNWRLTYIGTTVTLYKSGAQVAQTTATRGLNAEASATAKVGARENGAGVFTEFATGYISNLVVNAVTWPLTQYPYAVQKQDPDLLGPELITSVEQAAPAIKGSQWTSLGSGRWQYAGDGTLNQLVFIALASQPAAGFLEFEIESITGTLSCTSGGSLTRGNFTAPGKYRYFYTNINEGAANGAAVSFQRPSAGVITSCVIKNISFKPMGTVTNFTLSGLWTVVQGSVSTNQATSIAVAGSPDASAYRALPAGLQANTPITIVYTALANASFQIRSAVQIYRSQTTLNDSNTFTFSLTAGQLADARIQVERSGGGISVQISSVSQGTVDSNPLTFINFNTANWQQA